MRRIVAIALLPLAVLADTPAADITVRRAPYVVSTVSSKSESAWATCKYCGSKISYERTYKWDVYDHKWVETTEAVPEVCRKCKPKETQQAKLDREEARLDREIKILETKQRIDEKERQLRRLRKVTR